jgi:CRP-like cAMP-binding protein
VVLARRTGNELLEAMPAGARAELVRRGELVDLSEKQVLGEPGLPVSRLYFPRTCVISIVLPLRSGQRAEAGTVGREGFVGIGALLHRPFDDLALVQIPGDAYAVDVYKAMAVLGEYDEVREVLTGYIGRAYLLAKQTSACNAFHSIEQRTARWLLTAQDRAGRSEFPLTQELLSHMVAATRARVGEVAVRMRVAGIIDYRRGRMQIRDRKRLERASCECYSATR